MVVHQYIDTDTLARTRDSRVQNAMTDMMSVMDENITGLIQMYTEESTEIGVPAHYDELANRLGLLALDYVRAAVKRQTESTTRRVRRR